ncbi:MAG TPA: hypothetical protein VFS49_10675, partial [Croceibacterium sp.]|nr:hypothetical protein [Croceibacterium sp.]
HPSKKRLRRGRLALVRAIGSAAFAVAAAVILVQGLIEGRFENHRYFGVVTFAEHPLGFIANAAFWLIGMVLIGIFARAAYWDARD